ncbi:hypothetical protein ACFYYR_20700 [Streptomyces sp. NPDC001922]|uniref:hypothetical protein n=1 Tax=Streptomyces sp. NPDC001922 TaxID=3364624 RepID=UPI00369D4014
MSRTPVPAPVGSTALSRQPLRRRAVRWTACAVLVISTVVLVAAGTVRSTALNRGYYQDVLDEQRAYDRLYDEVLVDPESSDVAQQLLARLPVPQGVVTSNLRTVLPPTAVRALTDQQIGNAVGYLRGDRPALRMTADLEPVLANLGDLIRIYFGDLFETVEEQPVPGLDGLAAEFGRGSGPERGPDGPHGSAGGPQASDGVGQPGGRGVTDGRHAQHGSGAARAVADLDRPSAEGLALVRKARALTLLGLGPGQTLAVFLGVLALLVFWAASPGSVARRLTALGAALATGGALAAVAVGTGRLFAPHAMVAPSPHWPRSLARLVEDVQTTAADRLMTAGLQAAVVPLAAGLLLVATGQVWGASGRRRAGAVTPRSPRVWAVTAGVAVLGSLGAALAPAAMGGSAPRRCQGSSALCDRRYDEVAQLAEYNAVPTPEARFIGPLQDPGITGRLDAGVRALLIDTHTWETPREAAGRRERPGLTPGNRNGLSPRIERLNPPRSGLWLCPSVCRGGAVALVPALRRIGIWLEAHPTEVVTLIVQDGTGAEDTVRAFREAGLEHLLYAPDDDPGRPWPTLGEMVDSGRRLVVFAEKADGPAPWYRNFHRYGTETPYAFRRPQDVSCVPDRGGPDKQLFLLNHFVTAGGGSRLDAGEANSSRRVLARVRACERQRGRPVTFIAVDHTTIGDARGAVDALNTARSTAPVTAGPTDGTTAAGPSGAGPADRAAGDAAMDGDGTDRAGTGR